jgi:hypothetical protein
VHSLTKFISGASGGRPFPFSCLLFLLPVGPLPWPGKQLARRLLKVRRVASSADIIAGAVCAADPAFISSLMDLHVGPFMLLGEEVSFEGLSRLAHAGCWPELCGHGCSQHLLWLA